MKESKFNHGEFPKFICTYELGKLSRWLRVLGYDTLYVKQCSAGEVAMVSIREARVIVTRSARVWEGFPCPQITIKSDRVGLQIKELINKLHLSVRRDRMFIRCVRCNSRLIPVPKNHIKTQIPFFVRKTQNEFTRCVRCGQIFWKGSHWTNAQIFLATLHSEQSS